mmetsp:Transcript_32434/g.29241  ORF Transcript_32434/g.29241 Transcript_32434/m.29241 type:complete len:274 (-) Transcript_32434:1236-2057(-)
MPEYLDKNFILSVELIHSTYTNVPSGKSDKSDNTNGVQVELKTLETFTAKMKLHRFGVHEYLPIIFDNMNFSLLQATIHSVVLDFRFRVDNTSFLLTDSNGNEIKDKADKNQCKTFGEYLRKNFKSVSYEKLSEKFTNVLKENYESLMAYYVELSNKCLLESHKKKYKSLLQTPMKLIIPDIWKATYGEDHKENENIKDKDKENLASCVLSEINFISGELLYLWFKFVELIKITPRFILEVLKNDYSKKIKERWGECFFRHIIKQTDFASNQG